MRAIGISRKAVQSEHIINIPDIFCGNEYLKENSVRMTYTRNYNFGWKVLPDLCHKAGKWEKTKGHQDDKLSQNCVFLIPNPQKAMLVGSTNLAKLQQLAHSLVHKWISIMPMHFGDILTNKLLMQLQRHSERWLSKELSIHVKFMPVKRQNRKMLKKKW